MCDKLANAVAELNEIIEGSEVVKTENKIAQLNDKIKSIDTSITLLEENGVEDKTICILKAEKEKIQNIVSHYEGVLVSKKEKVEESRAILQFIKWRICEHEHKVNVGFDYHKRIDEYKCTVCGAYL